MTFDPIFALAMTTLGSVFCATLVQLVSLRREQTRAQRARAISDFARRERDARLRRAGRR